MKIRFMIQMKKMKSIVLRMMNIKNPKAMKNQKEATKLLKHLLIKRRNTLIKARRNLL